jgi:hypothetical protein
MIALQNDCLLFQLATGESVPCSAEMISVEIVGGQDRQLDPEVLRHAAASVFHYFKKELMRESVSVGEFAVALEKVLRQLGFTLQDDDVKESAARKIIESDLRVLACQTAGSLELFFYPALRSELRSQLKQSPKVLRFRGLRGCVKQLAGARRWSHRCDQLQDQIVSYLRECLSADREQTACALVVE